MIFDEPVQGQVRFRSYQSLAMYAALLKDSDLLGRRPRRRHHIYWGELQSRTASIELPMIERMMSICKGGPL